MTQQQLDRHPSPQDPDHPHLTCDCCYEPPGRISGDLDFMYQNRLISIEWDYFPESNDLELTAISDNTGGKHNGQYPASDTEKRKFERLAWMVATL